MGGWRRGAPSTRRRSRGSFFLGGRTPPSSSAEVNSASSPHSPSVLRARLSLAAVLDASKLLPLVAFLGLRLRGSFFSGGRTPLSSHLWSSRRGFAARLQCCRNERRGEGRPRGRRTQCALEEQPSLDRISNSNGVHQAFNQQKL